jgi:preprotein translocase subunit SecE
MGIREDVKREGAGQPDADPPEDHLDEGAPAEAAAEPHAELPEALPEGDDPHGEAAPEDVPVGVASPTQLGTKRFVYAAYFSGAIGIAFLLSKVLDFAWFKLQSYKPAIGEPRDEIIMPLSALIGALVAVYYWYRTRARELAEEVATEMAKVTWPSRTEVTNGTFVVIVTTVVSTVFFALMDKFWGFVTNLVYGGS